MAGRRTSSWLVIAVAVTALVAVAGFWLAWRAHLGADRAARLAAEAGAVVPKIPPPVIPDAPRIPEVPKPQPK
jgi:hypothetical protein